MKTYMNLKERSNYLFLNALIKQARNIIEEMSKSKRANKQALTHFRTGVTWLTKGLTAWRDTVDAKSLDTVDRECEMFAVGTFLHKDAQKHVTEMHQRERDMRLTADKEVGHDYTRDLAEFALKAICRGCNGEHKERGCRLWEAYNALLIEPWDVDHAMCEYAGTGNVEEVTR